MSSDKTKVMVVDDEPLAQQRLISLLDEIGGYEVVAQAANGEEAVDQYQSKLPDIVLMDIRMPVMDGLQAAQELKAKGILTKIIFTTAYDEHALSAFEASAVDYVLKPVAMDRLKQALEKAQRIQDPQVTEESICAQSHGKIELIPIKNVVYFQAEHKYITVRHIDGEAIIEDSLVNLERRYPHLLRIHRNALVNGQYLMAMEKQALGPLQVKFRGIDDRLEVSRRHISNLRKYLKNM